MTDKQYNLYNLEAQFKIYLLAENISLVSVKNYLSDIKHFFGWLTFRLNKKTDDQSPTKDNIIGLINSESLTKYKAFLSDDKLPRTTINRRLSTIRKFCSFCISQGWMKQNPAKVVKNLELKIKKHGLNSNDILSQFQSDLYKKNLDRKIIISCLNDIQEFLQITKIYG